MSEPSKAAMEAASGILHLTMQKDYLVARKIDSAMKPERDAAEKMAEVLHELHHHVESRLYTGRITYALAAYESARKGTK